MTDMRRITFAIDTEGRVTYGTHMRGLRVIAYGDTYVLVDSDNPRLGHAVLDPEGAVLRAHLDASGGRDAALAAAAPIVARRRWQAETQTPVPVTAANGQFTMLADGRTSGRLDQAIGTAADYERAVGPGSWATHWKGADGAFVVVGLADMRSLRLQLAAHVQACFAREIAIGAALQAAPTADAVRATLDAEMEAGWPAPIQT